MEARCPHCHNVFYLENAAENAALRCTVCNASFVLPQKSNTVSTAADLIIDVRAEPVQQEAGGEQGEADHLRETTGVHPRRSGRIVLKNVIIRENTGGGCCGCGCLLLLLFIILWLVGCATVMHG